MMVATIQERESPPPELVFGGSDLDLQSLDPRQLPITVDRSRVLRHSGTETIARTRQDITISFGEATLKMAW